MSNESNDADVIILGAGFAGLAAADKLVDAGRTVIIVEARDRVGGRTRTDRLDEDRWVDIGGQWFGPGQNECYALARRFGKKIWAMHTEGKNILHMRSEARPYRGLIPTCLNPWDLANIGWAFLRLEILSKTVPLEAPWMAPGARKLDQLTVGDWMRRNIHSKTAYTVIQVAIESVFAAHPDDLSLLHALFYLHSGGGLESLTSSQGGAQQDRVEGGMQGIAEALADDLRERGATVLLREAATHVIQEDRINVLTDDLSLTSDHVISTIPPVLAAELEFEPALDGRHRALLQRLTPGSVIKCFAFYERPFWRDDGLSGSAVGDLGPVHVAFDATPPGAPFGLLMGFIEGRDSKVFGELDQSARREATLTAFTRFFGPKASSPTHYLDHVWAHETWSRGCYAAVLPPGLLTDLGPAIRQPHQRVHFAGTETATHWNGYIEGAIRSGHRAATEVMAHV